MYAKFSSAQLSRAAVHDPYRTVNSVDGEQVDLDTPNTKSDVFSLHVHLTSESADMVVCRWFDQMKSTVVLVTARPDQDDDESRSPFQVFQLREAARSNMF